MDVVYICRNGENEELRYSLRSLRNLPHERVWIFGGCPKWVTGVEHVRVEQHSNKYANGRKLFRAIVEHPDVSDPFVLMNDDFYIMRPVDGVPELNLGTMREVIDNYHERGIESRYAAGMRQSLGLLEQMGYDEPLSFAAHVPIVVHKAPFTRTLDIGDASGIWAFHARTVYGNLAGMTGTTIADVKVKRVGDPMPDGPWLSSCDATISYLKPLLEWALPGHGPYEDPDWRKRRRRDRAPKIQVFTHLEEEVVLYTSPERVERNGKLIAFRGETMPRTEALRRGLIVIAEEPAASDVEAAPVAVAEDPHVITVGGVDSVEYPGHDDEDDDCAEDDPSREEPQEPEHYSVNEAGRYVCSACGKDYATEKGAGDHYRAKH